MGNLLRVMHQSVCLGYAITLDNLMQYQDALCYVIIHGDEYWPHIESFSKELLQCSALLCPTSDNTWIY